MEFNNETIRIHPAADIFPQMSDSEFQSLKDDIAENGQLEKVVLYKGQLLDGRHRYRACTNLEIEVDWREIEGDIDPYQYVLSANLHRRHLTPSQASMYAARAKELFSEAAKERQSENARRNNSKVENFPPLETAKSRDQAGEAFNVSGRSVDHASKVLDQGVPELAAAVDSGSLAVSKAAKIAVMPKQEQEELVKDGFERKESDCTNRLEDHSTNESRRSIRDEKSKKTIRRLFQTLSDESKREIMKFVLFDIDALRPEKLDSFKDELDQIARDYSPYSPV